jgi:hypothetical protein
LLFPQRFLAQVIQFLGFVEQVEAVALSGVHGMNALRGQSQETRGVLQSEA